MGKEKKGKTEEKNDVEEKKKRFYSVKVELEEADWKKLRKLAIDFDSSVGRLVGGMIGECMKDEGVFPWKKIGSEY